MGLGPDDDQVKAGRMVAVVAVAASVVGCTATHRPAAVAATARAGVSLPAGSAVHCPVLARPDANGHPAVPAAPAAAQRLAPLQTPSELVVCRYRGFRLFRLNGARQVHSGLAAVGAELAWSPRDLGGPRACTAIAGRHTPYLLGLRYPSGVRWVTTAYDINGCELSSNGAFVSDAYLGLEADHAFASGTWTGGIGREPAGTCRAWPSGRWGQDRQLVPGTPTRLTLCSADGTPGARQSVVHVTRDYSALVTALNRRNTQVTANMCDPHGEEVVGYEARFDYAEGPAVVVDIRKNCDPRLTNGSLDADSTAQIWAMVGDLAHHPS